MKNLERLMKEKQITQVELANTTGVTRQSIMNYLSGSYKPFTVWITSAACHFNVSVDFLLDLSEFRSSKEYEEVIRNQIKEDILNLFNK